MATGDKLVTLDQLKLVNDRVLDKSGDTMTGTLMVNNGSGKGVELYKSAEGGNIRIWSPDGTSSYELDSYDNNSLRIVASNQSNQSAHPLMQVFENSTEAKLNIYGTGSMYIQHFRKVGSSSAHIGSFIHHGNNGQISFYVYPDTNTTSSSSNREIYRLPVPAASNASQKSYDILTTKSAVSVDQGGTGATTPAAARTNLGITPAGIGALPTSGGTMTGTLNMGQSTASSGAKSISWKTADGTTFDIRPYNNLFQLVRTSGGTVSNVFGVNSDGTYSVGNASNLRSVISAAPNIIFADTDTGANALNSKLSAISGAGTANVQIPGVVMNVLTNGTYSGGCYGMAVRFTTNDYRFDVVQYNGAIRYAFSCTVTSSAITPGTVYKYIGTQA